MACGEGRGDSLVSLSASSNADPALLDELRLLLREDMFLSRSSYSDELEYSWLYMRKQVGGGVGHA